MSQNKIKNSYNKKIKLLDTYNKFYFEKSSPKVSDQTYDELKEEILLLEKKYDYLIMFDSEHDSGVLPLKFFEYIQSTKPIICVGGRANSEVKQILKDLKRGIILEDQNQIFNFLDKKIYLNLETTLNKRDNYKYSYKKTAMNFEDFILKNLYS